MYKEIVGIVASLLILASMLFKTSTFKQALWLRILNLLGSVMFIVYGLIIPAYSTAIVNFILVFVNIYHICILVKARKNESKSREDERPC